MPVGGKQRREQRHRDHPAPEARRDHARDRVDRHHLHRRDLLGRLHQADLGGDRRAGAAGEQQARHHRAELAHQRQRHQHAERLGGAEALQRLVALQREHHADEQARHQDDDERQHAGEVDLARWSGGSGAARCPSAAPGRRGSGWRSPGARPARSRCCPRRSRRAAQRGDLRSGRQPRSRSAAYSGAG